RHVTQLEWSLLAAEISQFISRTMVAIDDATANASSRAYEHVDVPHATLPIAVKAWMSGNVIAENSQHGLAREIQSEIPSGPGHLKIPNSVSKQTRTQNATDRLF